MSLDSTPRPMREVRAFSMDEFADMGKPHLLGKALRKFSKFSAHKQDKRFKMPERGLKIVKSSNINHTPKKLPYL